MPDSSHRHALLALQSAAAAGLSYLALRALFRRAKLADRAKSAVVAWRKWRSFPNGIIYLRGDDDGDGKARRSIPAVLIIFLHGGFVSPGRYVGLCRAIQRAAFKDDGAVVHVGIGSYFLNIPSLLGHDETNAIVDAVLSRAKSELGRSSFDTVLVAGHSVSTHEAMVGALPSKIDGAIILGGTANSAGRFPPPFPTRSLASYPKPVLTAIGDRDGFLRCWALTDELDALDQYAERAEGSGNISQVKRRRERMDLDKPVLCLPEVNHMQMADGAVTGIHARTGRSDLDSDLTLDDAWELTGSAVADFVVYHATSKNEGRRSEERERRRGSLLQRTRETREALAPFRALSDPGEVHRFAEDLQRDVMMSPPPVPTPPAPRVPTEASEPATTQAAVRPPPEVRAHWHETKEDFLYSKPSVSLDDDGDDGTGTSAVVVHVHVLPQAPLRFAHPPQLSPTLAIKCKSREGVLSLISSGRDDAHGGSNLDSLEVQKNPQPSLADLNRRTFDRVLNEVVSPQQRERYLKHGRPLRFLPDLCFDKFEAPKWVDAPIELTYGDDDGRERGSGGAACCYLRSPTVTTPPDLMPAKFAGMWYGKPLSPAQAYEYVVFDAFKDVPGGGS